MNKSSITKRWVRGSLLTTMMVLVLATVFLVFFVRNSYYSAADNAILSRINSINGTITASSRMSDSERIQMLYRMSEEFTEKDKYGASELFTLSDFEDVREDTLFAKWYMNNKFGGVPSLQSLEKLFVEDGKK